MNRQDLSASCTPWAGGIFRPVDSRAYSLPQPIPLQGAANLRRYRVVRLSSSLSLNVQALLAFLARFFAVTGCGGALRMRRSASSNGIGVRCGLSAGRGLAGVVMVGV